MSRSRRRAGFTLLEVLIAVFVLGTVLGSLITLVTGNLSRLSDARRELREMGLAEERIREIEAEILAGDELRVGVNVGRFGAPNDDLVWQVIVEPFRIPIPPGIEGVVPASPLFEIGDEPAGGELRRVEVRVFSAEDEPESAWPLVILVVEPPSEDLVPEEEIS